LNIEAEDNDHPVLVETERQLREYFAGRRRQFTLPLDVAGTAFQRKVWEALMTIPFGEKRSYGEVAAQIGSPGAARAVGAASGRNPVSIVTPCHRVVGSNGALTGFAGGLDVKTKLLSYEESAHSRSV
jgi:methylated-DNA-[protein]-cysteine S-methyltransferase